MFYIRRLWDRFLHPDGTAIPVDWVKPAPPSSKEWKKYLGNSAAAGNKN